MRVKTQSLLLVVTSLLVLLNGGLSLRHAGSSLHHKKGGAASESQNELHLIEKQNQNCEKVMTDLMNDIKIEKPMMPHRHDTETENKLADSQMKFGSLFLKGIRIAID